MQKLVSRVTVFVAVSVVISATAPISSASVGSDSGAEALDLSDMALPRIVNGVPTQSRSRTGALLQRGFGQFAQICTGTLIGCETFLTAAHCVCPSNTTCSPSGTSVFRVYLQHAGIVELDSIDVHPGYLFGVQSDIAVITLQDPVTGLPPIPINTAMDPPYGSNGIIAGFGLTVGNARDSGLLRQGEITTSSCGGVFDPVPEPEHVCWTFSSPLGDPGTNSNSCSGDSGGPLFVDLGAGEVVAGVTSGGDSSNCLPTDVSFDANVFQNAAFIQGIGGADLSNTTCGAGSQVGDASTEIFEFEGVPLSKAAQKCRREIRKQYARYVFSAMRAHSRCIDAVGEGTAAGPCPDAGALAALATAEEKVAPSRIDSRCAGVLTSDARLSGLCAGAANGNDVADCLVIAGDTAVSNMLDVAYADPAPLGPVAAPACQARIGVSAVKYEKSMAKLYTKCQGNQDKDKVIDCLDSRAQSKATTARSRFASGISSLCADTDVTALDSEAIFGASCAGVATTGDLATCAADEYDATILTLLSVLEDVIRPVSQSVTVPAGTTRLLVTMNAEEGAGHDLDLRVKLGSPPTAGSFDASSTNGGVYEAIDITAPTAGDWFIGVEELSGRTVPFQLTVTLFKP